MIERISTLAALVRSRVPLVHNLTNYVTVNDVANAELAIGGSALMADAMEEIADMVAIASAVNVNIGTLNERTIPAFLEAGRQANATGTPLVFDPVGAGASTLRNETTRRFLDQVHPTVIRGNLSEISFVAGLEANTRGVDSAIDSEADAVAVARSVAAAYRCIVAITGAVDVVSDGVRVVRIANGSPAMSKITGTGCMCDGLIGCFIGVLGQEATGTEVLEATSAAIVSMGLAGELAESDLLASGRFGTGSLRVGIIDRLSTMGSDEYHASAQVEVDA